MFLPQKGVGSGIDLDSVYKVGSLFPAAGASSRPQSSDMT